MSYYEDLSKYQYTKNNESEDALNIGWLDCSQECTKGEVPKEFVDKLWGFLCVKAEEKRGFHECNLCSIDTGYLSVTNKIEGSAEIRVIGSDGKVYASPNLNISLCYRT